MLEIGTDVEVIPMRFYDLEHFTFVMTLGVIVYIKPQFFVWLGRRFAVQFMLPNGVISRGFYSRGELTRLYDAEESTEGWQTNVGR